MKKIRKMLEKFLFMMVLLISANMVVHATESEGLTPCKVEITVVDMLEQCDGFVNVTFNLSDGTQKDFVYYKEYWGADQSNVVYLESMGISTLTTTVSTQGWEVVDANTFEPITEMEIVPFGELKLELAIIPTSDNASYGDMVDTIKKGSTVTGDVLAQLGLATQESASTSTSTDSASGIGESLDGADEVFQNFLNVTACMETDASWDTVINSVYATGIRGSYEKLYLSSVKGATKEQWDALSGYEVFIYAETYLRFASWSQTVMSLDSYINNGEKGIQYFERSVTGLFTGTNSEEITEAYDKLVHWQIEFYRTYNYPYNFITGKTYAEETGVLSVSESSEDEEMSSISEEIKNELTDEEIAEIKDNEKSSGVWGAFLEKLSGMWFTLIILVILFIAYMVVRYIRKKRAMDEMTDDGK